MTAMLKEWKVSDRISFKDWQMAVLEVWPDAVFDDEGFATMAWVTPEGYKGMWYDRPRTGEASVRCWMWME